MIYYFSGTGNTRYVAGLLAEQLNTGLTSMTQATPEMAARDAEGFMFPVHAWGVPPLVRDFIRRIPPVPGRKVWMVCTCGDDTGRAPEMFRRDAEKRGLEVTYMASVMMPNTYNILPGFDVDPQEVEQAKIAAAPEAVKKISDNIQSGHRGNDCHEGSLPSLKTKLVWPLHNRFGIRPQMFRVSADCTGCGLCAKSCPTSNIQLADGRPHWGKECTTCLACMHICPQRAIDFGSLSRKKGRFRHTYK